LTSPSRKLIGRRRPPGHGIFTSAASIACVRAATQDDWPDVTPAPVPQLTDTIVAMDQPLPPLGQSLLGVAIALDEHYTGHRPDIDPKTATGRQADDYMDERVARLMPGLVRQQQP
jgi:hypothetical protein